MIIMNMTELIIRSNMIQLLMSVLSLRIHTETDDDMMLDGNGEKNEMIVAETLIRLSNDVRNIMKPMINMRFVYLLMNKTYLFYNNLPLW